MITKNIKKIKFEGLKPKFTIFGRTENIFKP